jgi:hypothetical protein
VTKEVVVSRVRAFISFDLDHDPHLKSQLVDQAASEGSLFTVADWSIRELAIDWHERLRKRIGNVDVLLVICGEYTETAASVNIEMAVAREIDRPYFLLDGRPGRSQIPFAALSTDLVLDWNPGTWREPAPTPKRGTSY